MNATGVANEIAELTQRLRSAIGTVISGKTNQIDLALLTLFAGGHLLIEDVPGVGKTMLAKSLAKAINAKVNRIQFTPDLLPSDVTGVAVWQAHTNSFEFIAGAIFANIVIADEINRASPKTQSALLEAMAEGQVSVDGVTRQLPAPFLVMATQNPIEMEGTYPLPEAQRDRFWVRIEMGYPTKDAELAMLNNHGSGDPLAELHPVCQAEQITNLASQVKLIHVSPQVQSYLIDILTATRTDKQIRLGASPRAGLQLLQASRVLAAMSGRDYVIPDDLQKLAVPLLAHRIMASPAAKLAGLSASELIKRCVAKVEVPAGS